MKNIKHWIIGILFLFLTNCGNQPNKQEPELNSKTINNPTAIEIMADVFEGNHSIVVVKEKMNSVMIAYNVDITEKNYEKCGSALVSLRKVTGVAAMDIIENMLEANTGEFGISFPDQAALSATLLEKG